MKFKICFILLLSIVLSTALEGQRANKKITISGAVTDSNQNPVENAIITIDNKRTNETTNRRGFYKIKIKPSVEKIGVFTFTSDTIEEVIKGRTTINFTLPASIAQQIKNQANAEDEEEIDIGYGTEKRQNVTRSVSKVDKQKNRYASYNNIYDLLNAEVPQVRISGTRITIQGASSINAGTDPLLVVDGMIVNSLDHIQPRMVESVEVLKGPAAAIYGTRGANGVLLINLISAEDNR